MPCSTDWEQCCHTVSPMVKKTIAYASRTLFKAERSYSKLEKEGLALVLGVWRFHLYLYGHEFTLYTDHLPLQSLFNTRRSMSTMVSQRIQRWTLTLAMYEYTIKHRPGKSNSNADALSRLPLPDTQSNIPLPSANGFLTH